MTYAADERVDAYIDALPDWQQAICRQVRDLVHAADPEVSETIKRSRQPYFVLKGNICALLAARDHVNVSIYDGGIVPDPDGIIRWARQQNCPYRCYPPGRGHQCACPHRYVQAHHCQQPCRRRRRKLKRER
jgi:uncharacterized protein YdhG (YjbR/CyaY superfamily)